MGPSTLAVFEGFPVAVVEPERTVWVGNTRDV
jgi:hypothetical protein